jgi:HAMP domain-containing protein/CheY-like chemotaxis protein
MPANQSALISSDSTYSSAQLQPLLNALRAVKAGDFSVRLPMRRNGVLNQICKEFNAVVTQNEQMAKEIVRVGRIVGREGRMTERAVLTDASGSWAESADSINTLIEDLARPTTEVARVITAVAEGDLAQKMALEIEGTPVKGEFLRIGTTVNTMVDQLSSFADEVTRVAREVGTEGILGGQAEVKGVSGIWKDLTDNVNGLAGNLTNQVRNIALVTTAVANGDLSQKITVDARGEILELKNTINTMVDQLNSFAAEVTRVAREVGTEGKLGGQAEVEGVSGTWKDLTDNVNFMASNLTTQVRGIVKVVTAVANGDLSQKLVVDAKGEVAALADTINSMTDTLGIFAEQVTRVAREVGTEGKLGGQAEVPNVAGTWKDLTDSVNGLASNLTNQVRNIALVTTAVANGDLSQTITVDVKGEILELKNTINVMVDQLSSFAAEVTRVAREVGTEGKLGGQAEVRGVSGTWKDLTDNVNSLAGNLTNQVRNIALVTTAVANGDLSQKITVDARGEILELKNTINVMVDQLNSFAAEVTRVAREVGTEGKLGGQAQVKGVSGTWKDLTDNVNSMASNLTDQVRNIALVTTAVANGDLSKKITVDVKGEILELKNTINVMVDQLNSFAAEVTRVAREVGTEGKLGGQAEVKGVSGTWKDLTDNVNFMASNLTTQVRGIVKVVTAVANGDMSQKLVVDAKGEVAALADTINSMIDTLEIFAEQVTTVAREVGTEGILGGQAKVPNVAGTWKDLTDNVNFMASNLTTQVRGIAKVVTGVANGDLKQKLVVDAKGEVAALADTINSMIDTLGIFAEQATTVAREVGTEGKLGGQAKVPGVAGTWKDLTDNVNFMANSLTVQVRAISDVATAVAEGDLTRSITVEAQGEVSALKNNINQMIANLKETTQKNTEQDWLKTNLARFSGMMQGQKTLESVSRLIMSELTPLVSAHHGAFYINETSGSEPALKLMSSYAYKERKTVANVFKFGEGLVGQCALEGKSILLQRVPGDYIQINSGLGEAPPLNIIVLPVLFEGEIMAVIELASFQAFSQIHMMFLDQLMESIGVVLNMISANMRTEELLQQSQSLTQELQSQSKELQSQQEQLKRTNTELEEQAKELEEKASLLAEQNDKVELKNREVELARAALEEKAEQLALSSKYKSEFLANMSHELRTPLNSMMILSKLLSDNTVGNLTQKQTEFANTIYSSGYDLLNLINEILDLSKVEAGKMAIDVTNVTLGEVSDYVERTFEHVALEKGLEFFVTIDPNVPITIRTDIQRLEQILRNLLSNAFKFTERGRVALQIGLGDRDIIHDNGDVYPASELIAFSVIDTGIGIPKDKQSLIFEAFQQADGTTSRRYGGTGLGLSISREITRLLGGRIVVDSTPGEGSKFTLYVPRFIKSPAHTVEDGGNETYVYSSPEAGQLQENGSFGSASSSFTRSTVSFDIEDDRDSLKAGDRILLIVEDDINFAGILLEMSRAQGFKSIVATRGDTGLDLAQRYRPDAITLDLKLAGLDGWTLLEQLKLDTHTRHIPVQVISVMDRQQGAAMGAISYLEKPVSSEDLQGALDHIKEFVDRGAKRLLVVEDNPVEREGVVALVGGDDVEVVAVGSGEEAEKAMEGQPFDCIVLDLALPDTTGLDLLRRIKKQTNYEDLPVIVHTAKDLSKQEEDQFKRYAVSVITKDSASMERLLDETSLFLHRVVSKMPADKRDIIEKLHQPAGAAPDADLKQSHNGNGRGGTHKSSAASAEPNPLREQFAELVGKKILVVDDDMRNIFAITSVLESCGLNVVFAENGKDSIELLTNSPDINLVLMDVMMPEMDGYETTRAIRQMNQFESLPIIALTAKAMRGDREKCIAAGASEYIPKPVDSEKLLSMIYKQLSQATHGRRTRSRKKLQHA